MENKEATCSVCGREHDTDEVPELDSTHLCADCASAMRAARSPERNAAMKSREARGQRGGLRLGDAL
jgi:hypothetical protein